MRICRGPHSWYMCFNLFRIKSAFHLLMLSYCMPFCFCSYIVNIGLIDKLYGCFLSIQSPVDEHPKISAFLQHASALLHNICKLCFTSTGRWGFLFYFLISNIWWIFGICLQSHCKLSQTSIKLTDSDADKDSGPSTINRQVVSSSRLAG